MANLNSSIINGFLRVLGKIKVESLEVESNDLVSNLNADLLDGKEGSEYASSTDVESLTEQVNTNTGNILSNLEKIQANTEAIGTNKNNIATLSSRLTTAEGNITTNKNNITTNRNNITSLTSRITVAEGDIDANQSEISLLKQKTDSTNINVSNLQSQVAANSTNIQNNSKEIDLLKTKTDETNANVATNTASIEKILEGTATVPSTEHAEYADNAGMLGGQLPTYYAKATDLSKYLPLTGGTLTGKTIISGSETDKRFFTRCIMGCVADGSAEGVLHLNYGNNHNVYINGDNIVYHSGNIPQASTTEKGIVQLNNTRTSTSTTQAATAAALKSAYDTLNTALTTHKDNTEVHLTEVDRSILTKANKFKGYYETETALKQAHPTGEAGDYAIVNSTDTVWIWDEDKEGGAGWKDGAGKGSVISVNNMTGEVVLTKSNLGLGNVDNTSDADKPISTAQQAALNAKVNKSGDTMTGDLKITSLARSQTGLVIQENGFLGDAFKICGMFSGSGDNNKFRILGSATNSNFENFKTLVEVGLSTGNALFLSTINSTSSTTGGLVSSGGLGVAKAINSGETITAGTDLKTKSGVVNFNDKANVQYNADNECIEFIFS